MKIFHSLVATSLVTPILGLHFPQLPLEPGLEPIVDAFAGKTEFSYNGVSGPLMWHDLDPEYGVCAKNKAQSPIVIDSSVDSAREGTLNIPPIQKTKFKNLGYTVQVTTATGTLTYRGTVYNLQQFHFHTPSEHRLFDEYYPLEVHFVFTHNISTVVIAMFVQLSEDGSADELLRSVLRKVNQIPNHNDVADIGPLRFDSIIGNFSSNKFYRYLGSLTTPPCTPGVTFLIPNTALPLDVATYNLAKKVMKFNSRYTQNKPSDPNLLLLASSALASPKSSPTGKSKDL